jgi:hypothetical protein
MAMIERNDDLPEIVIEGAVNQDINLPQEQQVEIV